MIAVFDSGYGGLTVLDALIKKLPQYDYLYLGDNQHYPYGDKTEAQITEYADRAVQHLFDQGATLIIFACNTASSNALRKAQAKYLNGKEEQERKILGVIIPVAEKVAKIARGGQVGLIATRSTINSRTYEQEISKLEPNIKLIPKACPLLVPLIEENWQHKPEAKMILKKYLRPLKSHNLQALILGCTHYPHMIKEIRQIMGKTPIISGPDIVANSLEKYLQRHPEIESKLTRQGQIRFQTTGDPEIFHTRTEKYLQRKISPVQKVQI